MLSAVILDNKALFDTSFHVSHSFPEYQIEPPHDKTNKMACAPSEDSDQSGHLPSLISLHCPHEESLGP